MEDIKLKKNPSFCDLAKMCVLALIFFQILPSADLMVASSSLTVSVLQPQINITVKLLYIEIIILSEFLKMYAVKTGRIFFLFLDKCQSAHRV